MTYAHPEALMSCDALVSRLGEPGLCILDATYHLPHLKRDARAEYEAGHIPGAAFFDIDAIADSATDLPHMLPSPAEFAAAAGALGIGNDTEVVVYDTYGLMSAARVWWTLRAFGHDRVAVLNGGLPKWKSLGLPMERSTPTLSPAKFTPKFRPELVRAKGQLMANLASKAEQVLDARAVGRFQGTMAEPRAGLRSGRIPGSRNLPFNRLVDTDEQTFLPAEELRDLYRKAGVDPAQPIVCSCGSGVTACALAFGLHLIGAKRVAVYDGSWAEWGLSGDTPVGTG
ncbi:MAG: 3-mercaptopyruvate sulfurtransferase [Rhodospirillales bacterium]|nr:3-mercaptopyruvate sulfurtransferase [Rhodospirillales bacterium]